VGGHIQALAGAFFLSTHFFSWISLYLVQAPVGVETANCRHEIAEEPESGSFVLILGGILALF
jgi:hypothetical protein